MHALLAHAYHLAQHALAVLLSPKLWPPLVALAVAGLARLAGLTRPANAAVPAPAVRTTPAARTAAARQALVPEPMQAAGPAPTLGQPSVAELAAAPNRTERITATALAATAAYAAAAAGWLLLDPHWTAWPPSPVARLPGLALLLLAETWLLTLARPPSAWLVALAAAALQAWWLRGAPTAGPALLACIPVFLGLAAALPISRYLARSAPRWGTCAAPLALAGCLLLTGASPHWARAALVPAAAALALLGAADAAPALAACVVILAASIIVASDRGRLLPVDAACLAPLLVWRLLRR